MSNAPVSMSLVDHATGMGHYKGVMLSNRPFGGSVAVNKPTAGPATFACRVVSSDIGLNVPIPTKEKMIKRPRKDSVLVKHKKWLSDLQKTKERLEAEYLEEAQKREEEKRQFQEHEKKMRELSRSILRTGADDKSGPETTTTADAKDAETSLNSDAKEVRKAEKKLAHPSKQSRPKWAISEEKAAAEEAEQQEQEEEDLLSFALSLDYDKLVSDVEVQTTLQRLTKRIAELEREAKEEEDREKDQAERAARREMLAMMAAAQASLQANGALSSDSKNDTNFLAYQHAKLLLDAADRDTDTEREAKHVHSTKSMSALLVAAREKIAEVAESYRQRRGGGGGGAKEEDSPVINGEPKIVVHEPSEGTRLEQKSSVANLPYMHRHPSV